MDYFHFKDYTRDKATLLRAYTENQIGYLRRLHPNVTTDTIKQFVESEIQQTLKKRSLSIISYPSYGNAKIDTVDLLKYTETMRENIITPAGVLYMPPSKIESFLKKKIVNNGTTRKIQKKIMFNAAHAGDLMTEQRANNNQSLIKIETNSIPGAYGSPHNFLFDQPGYNAVTATARHSIMCGYAHVERMIEGNYYFPTMEHLINHCIQMIRMCPSNIGQVISTFNIYIPTVKEISDHFQDSLRLYMFVTKSIRTRLERFISSLSVNERTYVYYAYCLKTLLTKNESFFRPFIKEFFRTDVTIDTTVDPKDIFSFNPDLLALLSGLNADIIKHETVSNAVASCPDGVRHLIAIGKHMQSMLDSIGSLIACFLRVDCDISDAMSHPKMIRKTVIVSDTDSVIFSTQSWIEWYVGKTSFDREAYSINGFVVFFVTMTLEQIFARLSTNLGASKEDIHRISMKNEFLYPLMLVTPLPKQYVGRVLVQEGFVLSKPKDDIKGLSFRSSTMCKETVKSGKEFGNWIFDTVMKDGTLTVTECLDRILAHENRIIKSLQQGEATFLKTTPIKETYKNMEQSVLYYWQLWDAVFKPRFGEFIIPNKGFEVPIIGDGKALSDERYLVRLRNYDFDLYNRLIVFLNENPRKITRIITPMSLKSIPEIIRPLIDVRSIIYSNSVPFIVTMRSLGIVWTDPDKKTLLSDIYTKRDVANEMEFSLSL